MNRLIFKTYHHSYVIFGTVFDFLNSFINDQVHEWIESSQNANNISATI